MKVYDMEVVDPTFSSEVIRMITLGKLGYQAVTLCSGDEGSIVIMQRERCASQAEEDAILADIREKRKETAQP